MKVSILDWSTLSENGSSTDAIQNTVWLAREADYLGYERLWLSEHHNMSILQGSSPEVLLAAVGAKTDRIRLGSGGVMLPNHSAYKVAENFRVLEALFPGRIDCGIGRASGGDAYSTAFLNPPENIDFSDQVTQLERFFHDDYERAIAMPKVLNAPPLWLLSAGSHPDSGRLAAERGMGLAIALFINPSATRAAVESYRRNFKPSPEFPEPRVLIALNVVVGDTPEKLSELKKASDYFRLMRDSGNYPKAVPSPETLERVTFSNAQNTYLAQIAKREVTGLVHEVVAQINDRADSYDADEVMLTMMTFDIEDKIRAYHQIADRIVS
ncbi:MsnO8 family LLM class oxidoreductase [Aliirhizobium cellulosilyticum]|uniref:Luciferase family oxidoreductase group 1 n=1 Tax=Aliirhizobium cellulosilyticum TaxID=393664 RepID=A0A7W6XBS8_9HYPH|nr:luciferase family oxidoreductase group 1 [Rhizobium cellulosilyticum]MBB4412419.1 luciferase family oxidoreductase group 1 [Rhizobium cellulosilyticum]MBB4447051.1 luciferase family oxidoreductase group 1 [Rhizobium cellulosilyticum]